MTSPSSAARPFDARGMRAPNSSVADAVRRSLQLALPRGAQVAVALVSGRSRKAVSLQIEGANALTLDVFLAALVSLPESDRLRVAREALAPAHLLPASIPSGRLLPSVIPPAAATFSVLGHLVEAAGLAEADGVITREEGAVLEKEVGSATALLGSIHSTVEAAMGKTLVP